MILIIAVFNNGGGGGGKYGFEFNLKLMVDRG